MKHVFVVGLFKSLRHRFEAECAVKDLFSSSVIADIGRQGTFTLLPVGQDATHAILAYLDSLTAFTDGHIVVFPYAKLTLGVETELATAAELGCTVIRAKNGVDGWPYVHKKPDTQILGQIYSRLWKDLPAAVAPARILVSHHFHSVQENNSQVLIADYVFNSCDSVAPHRFEFMKNSIDALSEIVINGHDGRIDSFFQEKGIEHAQTGGISITLTVCDDGNIVHEDTVSTHLKKGDNTTPAAAARLYYHLFSHKGINYVAVLYAGPHPERDISWTHHI